MFLAPGGRRLGKKAMKIRLVPWGEGVPRNRPRTEEGEARRGPPGCSRPLDITAVDPAMMIRSFGKIFSVAAEKPL
ncbi:hypothetical protein GCM10010140_30210 [Streptosporangium pseudovulgare]|uniref:Uncharacterized protein n=1 Tax=Streptosporangium pseudovulgare TaxID=35765 RepID=A0ABQ2QUQ7_9ACTN|nr:hypothetical protein GCM10010140_30210 [Streptosporangium pseudovulgare]